MLKKVKLKAVFQNVHFGKSELTNYKELQKSRLWQGHPKTHEAYLFISRSGNQLVWVTHVETYVSAGGTKGTRIQSTKMRLTHGVWSPMMLQNYAKSVGLSLEGFTDFSTQHKARRAKKRAA